jgi:putative flippase GtrA
MSALASLLASFGIRDDMLQFVRFCLVGVVNTLTTFLSYVAITRSSSFFLEHYVSAEALAYFAGTIVSFTLNRSWTFRRTSAITAREVARFYVALLGGLAVNVTVVYLLVEWFKLNDIIAVALSLIITIAWNFLFMKFWVFAANRTEA